MHRQQGVGIRHAVAGHAGVAVKGQVQPLLVIEPMGLARGVIGTEPYPLKKKFDSDTHETA